ncbi:hypothetical protein HO173_009883 [Letharia columbiana]|uniref:Uncharacterized protein n=1 Tax=Letharia columbiana TaxID=112416 RepID=A0A8H6FP00_9LECA|nr:uncharacterized protein HO173_009883 [Letharia columbiana]KAF6232046.1 hypothetical protein HO173_009883 [Letharia columbiana]
MVSVRHAWPLDLDRPVHSPEHRHDKGKRTEVLVVEEDTTVEDIDVTVHLPGPPPEGYEQHQEGGTKEREDTEYPLTTYTLPDGSVTVVSGPKPTHAGSRHGAGNGKHFAPPSKPETTGVDSSAGEAPTSNPTATSSAAGDSGSGSGPSLLSGGGTSPSSATLSAGSFASLENPDLDYAPSTVVDHTTSSSTAADSPATTTTPASSVVPANDSPASTAASSAAAPSHSGGYPFSAVVAFGDNLSDNGNGSYAHNVAAWSPTNVVDGNTIYGARTWTSGPVAVSYLTDLLGVPMDQNFAFGGAWGGSRFGATIDDTMQQSNFSASLADGPWFNPRRIQ